MTLLRIGATASSCILFTILSWPTFVRSEEPSDPGRWWTPESYTQQNALEETLQATPNTESLRTLHDDLSSDPHPAGTAGDEVMIEKLMNAFTAIGLEPERHRFWAYLPQAVSAKLEIVRGQNRPGPEGMKGVGPTRTDAGSLSLKLIEDALPEDPFTDDPRLIFGWNAYSGSGAVTGSVVYVNYGTLEDFRELDTLGVSVKGKIALARYGRNYRGFKAKFAQEAGAIGLIMYTDPADSGFERGDVYPDGGWANGSYIQRGSVKTLDYPGDPLTPGIEATRSAKRVDPQTLALPKIPVQPIGYRSAAEILARMDANKVPEEWQGGLPFDYHLSGDLQVRLEVRQTRKIVESSNVFARIEGERFPEQLVIVGCHFDAWTFGAGDPQSGTILVYEVAKSFAKAAKAGHRPDRTVLFANWGAEEYGIIGSTEWCEGQADNLRKNAVAYINLDMATMGTNFSSSSAPLLQSIIADAVRAVPHCKRDMTVYDDWRDRQSLTASEPLRFGNLGGGSDHIALSCHLGVPCASIRAGGSPGVSYHSNYETLSWYRKVVGDDYGPAKMLTGVVNVVAARLANASLLPLDWLDYATNTRRHLETMRTRAEALGHEWPSEAHEDLNGSIALFEISGRNVQNRIHRQLAKDKLTDSQLSRMNQIVLQMDRTWLTKEGLPGRPWYRNLYAASDPNSGYAAWMLPALRHAVESDGRVAAELARCRAVFERLTDKILELDGIIRE